MSQALISSAVTAATTNSNSAQEELPSATVQELLNLVKSLYKVIEGLNARLEIFEKNSPKEVSKSANKKDVIKSVSDFSVNENKVVSNVGKLSPNTSKNVHENVKITQNPGY